MIEGLTWEGVAMVIVISALAAGSITETVKKAIQQGVIERTGDKPWWRGTILRVVSVISGASFGWLMLPEMPTMGLILGIGSGSVTTEAVGLGQRMLRKKNGGGKARGGKPRVQVTTDFVEGGQTEFRRAIKEEDLK